MRSILFEYAPNGSYKAGAYYGRREAESRLTEICMKADGAYNISHGEVTWADTGSLTYLAIDEETAFRNGNYIGVSGELKKFKSDVFIDCFDKSWQVYSKTDIFGNADVYEQENQFMLAVRKRMDFLVEDIPVEKLIADYLYDPDCQAAFDRSRYIESLLLDVPMAPVAISHSREIIDGRQRINTLRAFMDSRFRLSGLETLSLLNGLYYCDLPRMVKNKLNGKLMRVYVYGNRTSKDIEKDIAGRLNRRKGDM